MRFQLRLGGLSFRGSCEYTEGLADAAEGVYELPTAVPGGPRLASKRTSKGPTSRGSRWSRQDKVFSSRSERLTKEKVFAKRDAAGQIKKRDEDIFLIYFCVYFDHMSSCTVVTSFQKREKNQNLNGTERPTTTTKKDFEGRERKKIILSFTNF